VDWHIVAFWCVKTYIEIGSYFVQDSLVSAPVVPTLFLNQEAMAIVLKIGEEKAGVLR
jgi:hypothetical protein